MKMQGLRRVFVAGAFVLVLVFVTATAAFARDYPPQPNSSTKVSAESVTQTASTPQGSLPFTGSNGLQLVWVGVALTGVGALLVVRMRRRRATTAL